MYREYDYSSRDESLPGEHTSGGAASGGAMKNGGGQMGETGGETSGSQMTAPAQKGEKRGTKRKQDGTWAKGTEPGPGRPKAIDKREYIAALAAGFPPERIVGLLEQAITEAVNTHSWRGIVAACEFAANYTLGKPKQTVQSTAAVGLSELLADVDTTTPLLPDVDAGADV